MTPGEDDLLRPVLFGSADVDSTCPMFLFFVLLRKCKSCGDHFVSSTALCFRDSQLKRACLVWFGLGPDQTCLDSELLLYIALNL